MPYSVRCSKDALKTLRRLPSNVAASIQSTVDQLAADPASQAANVRKLHGREGYRLRVGDFHVIYVIENEPLVIVVLTIGPRGGSMTKPQTIEINGNRAVVLPLADYEALVARAEKLDDIEQFDSAMSRLAGGEETFPKSVADRLAGGESPIRVFREHRGLSQRDLAAAAGISVPAVSKIERTRKASIDTLLAIASLLGVTIDDLV